MDFQRRYVFMTTTHILGRYGMHIVRAATHRRARSMLLQIFVTNNADGSAWSCVFARMHVGVC
jgi:hypothetical protein